MQNRAPISCVRPIGYEECIGVGRVLGMVSSCMPSRAIEQQTVACLSHPRLNPQKARALATRQEPQDIQVPLNTLHFKMVPVIWLTQPPARHHEAIHLSHGCTRRQSTHVEEKTRKQIYNGGKIRRFVCSNGGSGIKFLLLGHCGKWGVGL